MNVNAMLCLEQKYSHSTHTETADQCRLIRSPGMVAIAGLASMFMVVLSLNVLAAPQMDMLVQADSVIVQPDTVFFLTPGDLAEHNTFTITNVGRDSVHVDTITVTENWFYELYDPNWEPLNYSAILMPGDSMAVTVMPALLTGGGMAGPILIDTISVVMNVGNRSVILVIDQDLVDAVPESSLSNNVTSAVLLQNYPNPFNAETTIEYSLPQAQRVSIRILNLLGKVVRTWISKEQSAGRHRLVWDGRDQHGRRVASGVYLYRIETGAFVLTRKMILLQ